MSKSGNFAHVFISALVLFCVASISGCYTSKIYRTTSLVPSARNSGGDLVMADLTRNNDILTEDFEPFFAAVQRGVQSNLPRMNVARRVLEERDSASPPRGTRHVVRFRAIDFADVRELNRGRAAALIMCASIVLFPACFFIRGPVTKEYVTMQWQMRIYDVTDLQPTPVRSQQDDEMVMSYDTSMLAPVKIGRYEIRVEAGLAPMDPSETVEFAREMADEMARGLLAAAAHDIRQGLQVRQPMPAPTAPAPTAPAPTAHSSATRS
ncbi:MAG: hypothetical protein GXP55_09485 [Deltaproteobacteria bacterium]|nr:hypothetical protein [Deltaproteobacteria bacterium]